ncbi:MAG: ABC transporter ATP-binding protein [Planctomycetota bacterium]|jgi:lipoprotein-releasing system ATP-binding protein|nr:ABC transporter ATP-binding protein [Blastopirellula sp.]
MAELIVTGLRKAYPTPSGPLTILDGVDLQLGQSENLAVVGPSGCGKSTFLQIIGTLDQPTAGEVRLGGVNPFALANRELAAFRNHRIGFIFQEHHLLPQLTALENVLLPVLAEQAVDAAAMDRGRQLLDQVGLGARSGHRPAELSGGERQRVAVARALIREPLLLLADEPTGSLDEQNARSIGELLLEVQSRAGAMLICVTHSPTLAGMFQIRRQLRAGKFVN